MPDGLIGGFKKFREKNYESNKTMPDLVEQGQTPEYIIISCIDSRSIPATIFRTQPGIFFTFHAMGAIVRPYKKGTALSASLQYALNYSGVKKIILLGHTKCGAIDALINEIDDPEIGSFLDVAQQALAIAKTKPGRPEDINRSTEEQVILQSRENLKSYPAVAKAMEKGQVHITPWLFDMDSGDIFEYDDSQNRFLNKTNMGENHCDTSSCSC